MFTGIIEEPGKVTSLRTTQAGRELLIKGEEVFKSLKIGDSISIDGTCLTVTEIRKDIFKAFLSRETLAQTTLGGVKIGDRVNLERAVTVGDRMGGHLITGHIDAIGTVYKIKKPRDCYEIEIEIPKPDMHLIVPKGSIAIDGVSLTIASIRDNIIKMFIIPYTAKMTTLGMKRRADKVNIEYDIIGKYIYQMQNVKCKINKKALSLK